MSRKAGCFLSGNSAKCCSIRHWKCPEKFRSNGKRSIKPYFYVKTAKLNFAVFLVLVATAALRAVKISTFVAVRNQKTIFLTSDSRELQARVKSNNRWFGI